nr:hypothetical protein [uncultured Prevotella sp.]
MKKETMAKYLTVSYMLLACCLGLMTSCSNEEYSTNTESLPEKEVSYTLNIDIAEIPILPAQTQLITDTKKEESEVEAPKPTTRSIELTVPQTGNYPSVSLKDGSKISVYLMLYPKTGYYGHKVFYSKKPVELTVKKGKLYMLSQQVEFLGGKYRVGNNERALKFNGEMAFHNKDHWMLSAIYAPGGTLNTANGELSFQGSMPTRFLNAGEKLTVGSDLNIPFILGTINNNKTRSTGVELEMDWDKTKVQEYNTGSPEANKPENYTFKIKKSVNFGFYPVGTLFCMRFKNDMKSIQVRPELMGQAYWLGRNGGSIDANKRKYDYSIKKVFCRSTSNKGVFHIGRDLDFQPNGTTTQSFDVQNVDINVDGKESPWLYFWQYSQGGAEDNSLEITFNMFNKDLYMDKLARVYTLSASNLQNSQGKQYYKTVKLRNTLAITPLYTVGPTFTSHIDGNLTWGNSGQSNAKIDENGKRGVGRVYSFQELRENNGRFTNPFTIKDPDGRATPADKLKWVLPTEKVVFSVFPKQIKGLSNIRGNYLRKQTVDGTQLVTVDGENVTDHAVYYYDGVKDIHGLNQKDGNSLRIYYAIRYVGTKYVSAWRYIEKGRWNGDLSNPNDEAIASKYIIQSRALTLDIGSHKTNGSYQFNYDKAKQYLEDHIIKNSFWSDDVKDGDKLNINSIDYLKPDVIKREFSLVGNWLLSTRNNTGSTFTFWLHPEGETRIIFAPLFQVSNQDRENLVKITAKKQGFGSTLSMVLPFLMPGQGK